MIEYVLAFKKILFQIFAKAFEDLTVIVFLMQYVKKKTFPVLFAKRKMHLVSSEPSGIPADWSIDKFCIKLFNLHILNGC